MQQTRNYTLTNSEPSGSCFICSRSSIASSRWRRVNFKRLSLLLRSSLGSKADARSSLAGFLYSNITELDMTKPSQATWSEASPTSCAAERKLIYSIQCCAHDYAQRIMRYQKIMWRLFIIKQEGRQRTKINSRASVQLLTIFYSIMLTLLNIFTVMEN